MSYEDLMARIAREIPELAGKLSAPRVTYVRSLQKTYITFESTVLAEEKQFLAMEKILRELFPGRGLADLHPGSFRYHKWRGGSHLGRHPGLFLHH